MLRRSFNIGLVVAIAIALFSVPVASATVLSISKVRFDWTSYNKKTKNIRGTWRITTSLDRSVDVSLLDINAENFKEEVSAPNLPDGTVAKTKSRLNVALTLQGKPYYIGSADLRGFKYLSWVSMTNTGAGVYMFYVLRRWTNSYVPYKVSASKNGSELSDSPKQVLSGMGPFGEDSVSFGYGDLSIRNIAQLSKGVAEPPEDIVFVWDPVNKQYVAGKLSTFMNKLSNIGGLPGYPWDPGVMDIETFWQKAHLDEWLTYRDYTQSINGDFNQFPDKSNLITEKADISKKVYIQGKSSWKEVPSEFKELRTYEDGGGTFRDFSKCWTDIASGVKYGWEQPRASTAPLLTVDASAEMFDTTLVIPKDGTPKITDIATSSEGIKGEPQTVVVEVKNTGKTKDDFEISGYTGESIYGTGPGRITLKPGESGSFSFQSVYSGTGTVSTEVTVKALGSGRTDTRTFTRKWKSGGPPTAKTGSVDGTVKSKEGVPLANVTVINESGTTPGTTTSKGGYWKLTDVPAGEKIDITFYKEGYKTKTITSPTIKPEETVHTYTTTLEKKGRGRGLPWVWIGVGIAVVSAAGIALMIMHERR